MLAMGYLGLLGEQALDLRVEILDLCVALLQHVIAVEYHAQGFEIELSSSAIRYLTER